MTCFGTSSTKNPKKGLHTITVGPILGSTTSDSVKIFARGEFDINNPGKHDCYILFRYRLGKIGDFKDPIIKKLNKNFDMTGIIKLLNLSSESIYQYQIVYTYYPNINYNGTKWNSKSELYTFTTYPDRKIKVDKFSFISGSCRYMFQVSEKYAFFDDRGDKTFRSMLESIKDYGDIKFSIMTGDQIYADDLNFIKSVSKIDKFNDKYKIAFTQPYIRKLMSTIPTYMMLDDHEIEDNWPHKANAKDWLVRYPNALHAYHIYQMSHSPVKPNSKYIWYTFNYANNDYFVTDVRTERDIEHNLIMSVDQLDALENWLFSSTSKVKFIVTSVPFLPEINSISGDKDKWGGFQDQRNELIEFIYDNDINNVVFIAGDVHCSFTVKIESKDKKCHIYSIVSSPFFWPYPHEQKKNFKYGELKITDKLTLNIESPPKVVSVDNYSVITVDDKQITVKVHGRKGELLMTDYYTLH